MGMPDEDGERCATKTKYLQTFLDRISFAPTCINFEWKFEIEELYTLEMVKGGALCSGGLPIMKLRGWLVNTTFSRPDTNTGVIGTGKSRQEFIPVGTTESGVVKTAFLLCKITTEHEVMEGFLYCGLRPFDPHNSIQELNDVQDRKGHKPIERKT